MVTVSSLTQWSLKRCGVRESFCSEYTIVCDAKDQKRLRSTLGLMRRKIRQCRKTDQNNEQ
jgi:hypothetical protein